MGRKVIKKSGYHYRFIPHNSLLTLQNLANNLTYIKDKDVALLKYIETLSSLVERMQTYSEKDFIRLSQRMLKKQLGVEAIVVSKILNDLVESKLIDRSKEGFKACEASWKYIVNYETLDRLSIDKSKINVKTDKMLTNEVKVDELEETEKIYFNVVKKVTLDESVIIFIENQKKNTFSAKPSELINTVYDNIEYNNAYNVCTVSNNINFTIPIVTVLYPTTKKAYVFNSTLNSTTSWCNSLVPLNESNEISSDLISVIRLLEQNYRISRPIEYSRVYTNFTNLGRIYRPFLRLNGKPLIGFDISNSQPLIASVLFDRYSMENYECLMDDVIEYKKECESGLFYEYFMKLNGIDLNCENARTKFKKEFFGKVFYTKEIKKENYLKTQFKEKYPICYEAIFDIKGGYYSNEYKNFPKLMTEIETTIMYDANIELIKMGYDVVNIFDSLYSDSIDAINKAKELVMSNFAYYNIKPKFKDIKY